MRILTFHFVTVDWSASTVTEKKREKPASRAIDLEALEKDYALTKARMQLAHSDVKHSNVGEYKLMYLSEEMMSMNRDVNNKGSHISSCSRVNISKNHRTPGVNILISTLV